jgi:sterol desaturase/sphingolipid hydroxylase (fatty acid hydroxylase superfamily)
MNFQEWILANGKNFQLALFYGLLVLLGVLEALVPQNRLPPDRKRRWVTNFVLSIFTGILLSCQPLSGLAASTWAVKEGWGLLNRVEPPAWEVLVLTVTVRSLSSWILHFFMHKIPVLWQIHQTHHLDTVMDISTTGRFHPVELLLSLLVGIPPIVLLGLPVWVLLVYECLEILIRNFSHANIHLPRGVDGALRLFISTPAMHRIHHSVLREEVDSNYGVIFSLWDRLLGTYTSPEGKDLSGMRLGQAGNEYSKVQSLWWLLKNPFSPTERDNGLSPK